jgi:hypothetical protein
MNERGMKWKARGDNGKKEKRKKRKKTGQE